MGRLNFCLNKRIVLPVNLSSTALAETNTGLQSST
jgi:hypothetical protein